MKIDTVDANDSFTLYNKESKLPKNVAYKKHRKTKEIIGYQVCVMINNKKYLKTFQNQQYSMDELLNHAIEYINSINKVKTIE
jgi:hypothetical protein